MTQSKSAYRLARGLTYSEAMTSDPKIAWLAWNLGENETTIVVFVNCGSTRLAFRGPSTRLENAHVFSVLRQPLLGLTLHLLAEQPISQDNANTRI